MKKTPAIIIGLVCAAAPSFAQSPKALDVRPYKGELVLAPNGRPIAPWKEIKHCPGGEEPCIPMIVNPDTREIAIVGGQLSTRFERTDRGQEVRRAETELDKAIRLAKEFDPATLGKRPS